MKKRKILTESLHSNNYNDIRDVHDAMFEIKWNMLYEFSIDLKKYKKQKKNKQFMYRQEWDLVPFGIVNKIWNDFSKLGFVPENQYSNLIKIQDMIITNIIKIDVNNEYCGHKEYMDSDVLVDYNISIEDNNEYYGDWCEDELSISRISDYGIEHLFNGVVKLLDAKTAEDKLIYIDHIFNIAHQRSDLSSWLIYGGRSSFNKLAGIEDDTNECLLSTIVKKIIKENNYILEHWYHGTPDARELEKQGSFSANTMTVDYVPDPIKYKKLQDEISNARSTNNKELYFKLLDIVPTTEKQFVYKKPLFLSDTYSVAKTYADKTAFDYQNSIKKIYVVDVTCSKTVKIVATGDRFRFIDIDKVRSGFINAGISNNDVDTALSMFNYHSNGKGIMTDVIAAIGNWFKFDCIDVVGVLDSYNGGSTKSTVRIVLDPTKAKIIKK